MSYDIGDSVHLACSFANTAGVPTNPTTVTVTITTPNGWELDYTPDHPATGSYTYDFLPTVVGKHLAKFTGTGTLTATEYIPFYVRDAAAELAGTYPMGKQSWKATP